MTDRPLPFYDREDFAGLLWDIRTHARDMQMYMEMHTWNHADTLPRAAEDARLACEASKDEALSQYDAWITERTDLITALALMDKAIEQLKLDCYMEVDGKDRQIAALSSKADVLERDVSFWYREYRLLAQETLQLRADLEALDQQWRATTAYAEALELGSDTAYWQEQAEMAREEAKAADMAAAYWKKVAGDRLDINIRLYETSVQATKQYRELETQYRKLQESIAAALDEAISPTQE